MVTAKRPIYIYLYRLAGKPVYVGQAVNVAARDKAHIAANGNAAVPFDKFLQKTGRDKFTLKVVGQVRDVPYGKKACALENRMMDKFGTYYRTSGRGWNFGRAVVNHTEESYLAYSTAQRAALNRTDVRTKISAATRAQFQKPGAHAKTSAGLRAYFQKPGAREKQSAAQKLRFQKPSERSKYSKMWRTYYQKPGARKRASAIQRAHWQKPGAREKHSTIQKLAHNKPDVRAIHRAALARPDVKKRHRIGSHTGQLRRAQEIANGTYRPTPCGLKRAKKIVTGLCGYNDCPRKRWGKYPECRKHTLYFRQTAREAKLRSRAA